MSPKVIDNRKHIRPFLVCFLSLTPYSTKTENAKGVKVAFETKPKALQKYAVAVLSRTERRIGFVERLVNRLPEA